MNSSWINLWSGAPLEKIIMMIISSNLVLDSNSEFLQSYPTWNQKFIYSTCNSCIFINENYGIVRNKILWNIWNISRNFGRGLTYFPRRSRGKYETRGHIFRGEAEKNIEIELNMTNISPKFCYVRYFISGTLFVSPASSPDISQNFRK